jgi:hypothetical protein
MSKDKPLRIRNSTAEFLIFTRQAGDEGIEVRVAEETVWLTQKLISVLFDKGRSTITEHLKNIFESGELDEKSVCRDFRHTAEDGKDYTTRFYNLDAIIAVGFRVNSARATQFRQWATGVLRDFSIRGYVLDKDRLKNGAFPRRLCRCGRRTQTCGQLLSVTYKFKSKGGRNHEQKQTHARRSRQKEHRTPSGPLFGGGIPHFCGGQRPRRRRGRLCG